MVFARLGKADSFEWWFHDFIVEGRRKKEEGRRKKEEGRRKKEEKIIPNPIYYLLFS
ncbi:hypothetical protein [Phormidium nigroviride]